MAASEIATGGGGDRLAPIAWPRRRRCDAPRMGLRLGTQRVGGAIVPMLAAAGTPWRRFLLCRTRGKGQVELGTVELGGGRRRLALGSGLRRGSRDRRCGRGVPAAGRRLHLDRGLRLRLRGPGLRGALRGGQRSLVEAPTEVVALLRGFAVAVARSQGEPLVGLGRILLDPDAARVQDS